jgi:hypothetical protein
MNIRPVLLPLAGAVVILIAGCRPTVGEQIAAFRKDVGTRQFGFEIPPGVRLDSIRVDSVQNRVLVDFSNELSNLPFREATTSRLVETVRRYFIGTVDTFAFTVRTLRRPVEDLVPNYFRTDTSRYDAGRMPRTGQPRPRPVVENVSRPFRPSMGLAGRNIGLWASHGWYFNQELNRWEWQRPRLFLTVEDLVPTAVTVPYLVPMLENAGANVFVPRERDIQANEVIVDNDSAGSGYSENAANGLRWIAGWSPGFAVGKTPYVAGVNPFRLGTYRMVPAIPGNVIARWTPRIPETGEYAVYISYASIDSGVADARYVVQHLGGMTEFLVNQQIGGGTWQYLGRFRFRAGRNADSGSVMMTAGSENPGTFLTTDAVRFGGGMGVVARNGQTSGRPKFVEASRYWLQFAGMPDTLVYSFTRERNDYRDDYASRAEYLNYLKGAPYGPNKDRTVRGLGIPIDLSLAFHTDAGITNGDSTIGTLSIYGLEAADSAIVFPDSVSRIANRDFADILQTQIVDDIRAKYDPQWNRRSLRNGDYSEARRPNMPAALLELLSHQNFQDMKFFLDPRFRFDVGRAIYKAMLRFLAAEYRSPYVVQPLPLTHFAATLTDSGALLRWRPRPDPNEPSALPTRYIVYTRVNDGGFDNGLMVDSPSVLIPSLRAGVIYSFRVTGVNDGGESFPSEVLSVCRTAAGSSSALIVNGFDRVSGPMTVDAQDFKGFLTDLDGGVPYGINVGFTGEQYNFLRSSAFRSNDAPGFGASFADREGYPIAGNTFDFPYVHGLALNECGLSFSSASRDAVTDSLVLLQPYSFVDLILGKQKTTHWQKAYGDSVNGVQYRAFPLPLRSVLTGYLNAGGSLFVSGSYVGSDIFSEAKQDTTGVPFARHVMRFDWVTDYAARTGRVTSVDTSFLPLGTELIYNTIPRLDIYPVESPDAVAPFDSSSQVLRYSENGFGAGIAFRKSYGIVATGFPFESMPDPRQRTILMRAVLRYLKR